MKHLECPIRQTAVTHVLAADAQRGTTGRVGNKRGKLKLSYSWTTSKKSQAAVINKKKKKKEKTQFRLIWWATASLELPQDCCFEHWGTSCCQETFYMIFHFVDNCWECCPSTLFEFISTRRLLYMFARRNSVFVTVGFSLGPCLLLSDESLQLLWTGVCSAYFSEDWVTACYGVWSIDLGFTC